MWGGHLWSRGYFFRSVGSTTDEAVEFYIKITQGKSLREKYYTVAGSNRKRREVEDPYIEYLRGNLKGKKRAVDLKQKALDEFVAG